MCIKYTEKGDETGMSKSHAFQFKHSNKIIIFWQYCIRDINYSAQPITTKTH
jgi:hypothetical protein